MNQSCFHCSRSQMAIDQADAKAERFLDYYASNLGSVDAKANEAAALEARNHLKFLKASFADHLQYSHASA